MLCFRYRVYIIFLAILLIVSACLSVFFMQYYSSILVSDTHFSDDLLYICEKGFDKPNNSKKEFVPKVFYDKTKVSKKTKAENNIKNNSRASRSFDIVGKGITVEEVKALQCKGCCWWPYHPTGIWCKPNENIVINASSGIRAYIGTRGNPYGYVPIMYELSPGENTISSSKGGLLYFSWYHSGTININITSGGTDSPLFILNKHSQADWQYMLDTMTASNFCEFLCDRAYICVARNNAYQYLNGKDPSILLQKVIQAVEWEDEIHGLSPLAIDQKNRPDPYPIAHIEDSSGLYYMFATDYHTGYNFDTTKAILDADAYSKDGWGPWHEQGHTRQVPTWNWTPDLGEVTVNNFSLYVENKFGLNSRIELENYYPIGFEFLNKQDKNYDDIDDLFVKLIMFWQLRLAFGKNFYPMMNRYIREFGYTQLPSTGSKEWGKQIFIYMSSMCSERNLTPFFEMWGIYPSAETKAKIAHLETLKQPIWNNRDNSYVVEYEIPDNYTVPKVPTVSPPDNLDKLEITLHSAMSNQFYLNINNNAIILWNPNDINNQKWQLLKQPDGNYLLYNKNADKYLKEDGILLGVANSTSDATKWRMLHLSSGILGHVYKIQSASTNKVLDVEGGSEVKNGTKVIPYISTEGANQRFFVDFLDYEQPDITDPTDPTDPPDVTDPIDPPDVTDPINPPDVTDPTDPTNPPGNITPPLDPPEINDPEKVSLYITLAIIGVVFGVVTVGILIVKKILISP